MAPLLLQFSIGYAVEHFYRRINNLEILRKYFAYVTTRTRSHVAAAAMRRAGTPSGFGRHHKGNPPLCGLRLWPERANPAIRAGLVAIGLVAALIVFADGVVFRSVLPDWYVRVFTGPFLSGRILVSMVRCVQEELCYRLLVMTLIIATVGRVWRGPDGRAAAPVVITAILVAQAVNMVPKEPPPTTYLEIPWSILRFYAPGLVWGWLYWRHGLVTPLLAHPAVHLVLQPALLVVLAA